MKERYLSKTPFLTFVYISKCNINLPCYLSVSKICSRCHVWAFKLKHDYIVPFFSYTVLDIADNTTMPCYFGNSKKRFLWTGLILTLNSSSGLVTLWFTFGQCNLQPYIWDWHSHTYKTKKCLATKSLSYQATKRSTLNWPTETHLKDFCICICFRYRLIYLSRLQVNPSMTACQFRRTLNDDNEDSEEHTLNIFWPYIERIFFTAEAKQPLKIGPFIRLGSSSKCHLSLTWISQVRLGPLKSPSPIVGHW